MHIQKTRDLITKYVEHHKLDGNVPIMIILSPDTSNKLHLQGLLELATTKNVPEVGLPRLKKVLKEDTTKGLLSASNMVSMWRC